MTPNEIRTILNRLDKFDERFDGLEGKFDVVQKLVGRYAVALALASSTIAFILARAI